MRFLDKFGGVKWHSYLSKKWVNYVICEIIYAEKCKKVPFYSLEPSGGLIPKSLILYKSVL